MSLETPAVIDELAVKSARTGLEKRPGNSSVAQGTVIVANNYFYRRGGAEVVALEESRALRALGWNMIPFSMHHEKNDASPYSEYFAQEIEFGNQYGLMKTALNALRIIYSRDAAQQIERLIQKTGASVLHAHNVYHHLSPSVLRSAKQRGLKVILSLHDFKLLCPAYSMTRQQKVCEECKPNRVHKVVVNRCMKGSLALSGLVFVESAIHRFAGLYRDNVDLFISPSQFLIDKFVEWGWPREKFQLIRNFVDPRQFDVSASRVGDEFLYFGRLSGEKGIATLIRAAAQSKVALAIVGHGPQEAELKALAQSLQARVRFLGYRSGAALWSEIAAARAVVLPAEWYENAPVSLLEAMACGKVIIAARIGGVPEIVNETTGFLFESGQVESLAARLESVHEMPAAQIELLGDAARKRVEADFSEQRHVELLQRVYRAPPAALS